MDSKQKILIAAVCGAIAGILFCILVPCFVCASADAPELEVEFQELRERVDKLERFALICAKVDSGFGPTWDCTSAAASESLNKTDSGGGDG